MLDKGRKEKAWDCMYGKDMYIPGNWMLDFFVGVLFSLREILNVLNIK